MGTFILNPESFSKILEVTGNAVESLTYLLSSLNDKVKKSRSTAEFSELLGEIQTIVDSAKHREDSLNSIDTWSGARGLTDKLHAFFNSTSWTEFQEYIVSKLVNKVPSDEITLDCIIGSQSEFLRAYSGSDGKSLEGEALNAMDNLFNAWLALHKMIMQDGFILAATAQGDVIKDAPGDAEKRAIKLKELIFDPVEGIGRYLSENKSDSKLNIVLHDQEKTEEATPVNEVE